MKTIFVFIYLFCYLDWFFFFTYLVAGCWCNPGHLSMGIWWWSKSPANASKLTCCSMGWWCRVGTHCNSYRFAFVCSVIKATTLQHVFISQYQLLSSFSVSVGGRIVPRFQELTPEKLGKVYFRHDMFTFLLFCWKCIFDAWCLLLAGCRLNATSGLLLGGTNGTIHFEPH